MVKRIIILVAGLLVLVAPSVSSTQAAVLAGKVRPIGGNHAVVTGRHGVVASNTITGTLTSMTNSSLTVSANSTSYTINISSTTKIVRHYNGASDMDELSVGDQLVVVGPQTATNTIGATRVKDLSIQEAWTHMSGTIQSVSGTTVPATVTVTVVRDHLNAPFSNGQSLSLAISSSTTVISPTAGHTSTMVGTAALPLLTAATGTTVTVLGVYNKVQNMFTTVYRIHLHRLHKATGSGPTATPAVPSSTATATPTAGGAGATTTPATTATTTTPTSRVVSVAGTIMSESGATAPAVLTVQTTRFGLITVNIGTSPAVVFTRRLGGQSSLDELGLGDQVTVQGTFTDSTNKVVNATSIRDSSIQDAATRAVLQITQITASGFVGTVKVDNSAVSHPFAVGQSLTVTVSSATKFLMPATAPATGEIAGSLSNLATNQIVTVLGTFNRLQNTYISTQLVHIHR